MLAVAGAQADMKQCPSSFVLRWLRVNSWHDLPCAAEAFALSGPEQRPIPSSALLVAEGARDTPTRRVNVREK